jgi:hypothetical protein
MERAENARERDRRSLVRLRTELSHLRARYDCGACSPAICAAIQRMEVELAWREHKEATLDSFKPLSDAAAPALDRIFKNRAERVAAPSPQAADRRNGVPTTPSENGQCQEQRRLRTWTRFHCCWKQPAARWQNTWLANRSAPPRLKGKSQACGGMSHTLAPRHCESKSNTAVAVLWMRGSSNGVHRRSWNWRR